MSALNQIDFDGVTYDLGGGGNPLIINVPALNTDISVSPAEVWEALESHRGVWIVYEGRLMMVTSYYGSAASPLVFAVDLASGRAYELYNYSGQTVMQLTLSRAPAGDMALLSVVTINGVRHLRINNTAANLRKSMSKHYNVTLNYSNTDLKLTSAWYNGGTYYFAAIGPENWDTGTGFRIMIFTAASYSDYPVCAIDTAEE